MQDLQQQAAEAQAVDHDHDGHEAQAPGRETLVQADADAEGTASEECTDVASKDTATASADTDAGDADGDSDGNGGGEQTSMFAQNAGWEDLGDDAVSARSVPVRAADADADGGGDGDRDEPSASPAAVGSAAQLRIVSLNVQLKKLSRSEINYLARTNADVVYLQEASPANAKALEGRLGMQSASYPAAESVILSRFPIVETQRMRFPGFSPAERDANERRVIKKLRRLYPDLPKKQLKKRAKEARKPRGMLAATINVNGKLVSLLDVHLSLRDHVSNTRELKALRREIKARRARGHNVIAGGDFNTNFALARGGKRDPKGKVRTKTDTVGEFKSRYGVRDPGNIGHKSNRREVQKLLREMSYYWDAPERRVDAGKHSVDPRKVLRKLTGARAPKIGSRRWKRLLSQLDGLTQGFFRARFDNLLGAGVDFKSSAIDHVRGTDHAAIRSDVRLR